MGKADWVWMPHPGHFICGHYCRFVLNTFVNGHIISTVGEYWPPETSRESWAEIKGITLKGIGDARDADYLKKLGYMDIGADRKYETMVFEAQKENEKTCCPFRIKNSSSIDFNGYNTSEDAYKGHLEMCEKYDIKGD